VVEHVSGEVRAYRAFVTGCGKMIARKQLANAKIDIGVHCPYMWDIDICLPSFGYCAIGTAP
jgi:hypothetical protein